MTVETQNAIEIFDRVLCGVDGTPSRSRPPVKRNASARRMECCVSRPSRT